jgi:hypothetical protein
LKTGADWAYEESGRIKRERRPDGLMVLFPTDRTARNRTCPS